ncbi:MAG: hypothetical protein NTW03_17795, partial [Verrucomicrobia bacterium]|nr:hypothetical protein [Verrucomicrobiota bacterium]
NSLLKLVPACLGAAVLIGVGAATTGGAAAVTLQGQVSLRSLSPGDIKAYGLTGLQGASGLSSVGVGQPAYLEALVNAAIPPTNILSVTWVLTNKPIGSLATLAASPLGTNVPTDDIADQINQTGAAVFQVAGRTMLRPDVAGQYKIAVTITTLSYGTTNLTQNISAGTYMGADVCRVCHSGGPQAPATYPGWSETLHATKFSRSIDGLVGSYSQSCISCHTVGYDTNTNAVNGGFDDIAKQLGWTFPAVLTNGNWANMQANYPTLAAVANIQCENCHGPGSEHAYAFGNTNLSNWPRIGKSWAAGNCGQCHDSPSHHSKSAEWKASLHARTTRTPSGPGREACARCHTPGGFAGYAATLGTTNTYTTNNADTVYGAIPCAACHDPHDATNPHQLRAATTVKLADGITTVTNAGLGGFCMNCHRSRNGSVSNSIVQYPLLQQTWAGGSSFGPHDNPASDMLEGVNGWTYGKVIPSSAHRNAVTNTCVGCHMQPVASTDPAFLLAGGHTMNMSYPVVANGVTNMVDKVDVCVQCHGPIDSFDMVKVDYNGDGVIEGVQTEVQHLLDKLSTLLPNSTYLASGNYVADGLVKSPSTKTNWPARFLQAGYNWQFVNNDHSKGVHNAAYAVGLLKASIADLTGDSNNDGLPDAWQTQYFGAGYATNTMALPNANPSGDGIPNWLKYALGLDPTVKGTAFSSGVVWANGNRLYSSTNASAIAIYTAAEVVFNTEVGKTYQIQSISQVNGTWQNLGTPIPGTGNTISYVTPTRTKVQQYYRVVSTP